MVARIMPFLFCEYNRLILFNLLGYVPFIFNGLSFRGNIHAVHPFSCSR